MQRRKFLRVVPAAVAGGFAAAPLAQQEQPRRITKDTLECGEKIFGVDFTDAEEEQALNPVNNNLENYERLRQIDVPLDTEPAVTFRPYLPGKKPKPGATPGAPIKVALQTPGPRPASLDDLAFLPVTALAAMIKKRDISSTELTRMYLDRLEKYGPKLNCVVTLTKDLALAQAAQADKEIRAGKYKGLLHGIPWGAKDLFATKGIPTTWGAGPFKNQVIDRDATVVTRLRDAGAVLVAKLSMGALAQGGRWFKGETKNPWNPDDPSNQRSSSSGSSAGPGSATAAGLVGFAIGTETRGSIISPSVANGVTGLRPTYGRISRYGAMALSWTMDKIGPMCRSVEDCAVVFNALYGPDGLDDTVVDAPFVWAPDVPLSKLKIGYIKAEFEPPQPDGRGAGAGPGEGGRGRGRGRGPSPEDLKLAEARRQVLNEALETYRKAGATLLPMELPGTITRASAAIGFVLSTEAAAAFDDLTRSPEIKDETL
jgi:Asp-tRNA(Asn)/Glu-tRNA(Gln) amidotransferase A subunit family amidase